MAQVIGEKSNPARAGATAPTGIGHSRFAAVAIVCIIACGAGLRIALADYSLWFDELASLVFAEKPLSVLWSGWMVRETNPPLFYSLLQGWLAAGANSIIEIRLLSIMIGAVGITILSVIAYRASGVRSAIYVALLASLSAQHIYYSQTVRAYILAFDGIALSLLGVALLVEARPKMGLGAALYAVGAVIAIYSHTTMLLWPVIAMLSLALAAWPRVRRFEPRFWGYVLAANAGIAVSTCWWFEMTLLQLKQSLGNIDWIAPLSVPDALEMVLRSSFLFRGEDTVTGVLAYASVALTIIAAVRGWANPSLRLISIVGLIAIAILFGAERAQPIMLERTLFWISIFPLLLLAGWLGDDRPSRFRQAVFTLVALALAGNLASAQRHFEIQDWIPSIHRIAATPNGALLVEHEALGLVARAACKLEFGEERCPFPLVVMKSASRSNVWANGLYEGPIVSPTSLSQSFGAKAQIFALRQGDADVVMSLRALGATIEPTRDRTWPEGPYHRVQLQVVPGGLRSSVPQ